MESSLEGDTFRKTDFRSWRELTPYAAAARELIPVKVMSVFQKQATSQQATRLWCLHTQIKHIRAHATLRVPLTLPSTNLYIGFPSSESSLCQCHCFKRDCR